MRKISIFTTISDPERRQDAWKEALECYLDFADEVVVVCGDYNKEFYESVGRKFGGEPHINQNGGMSFWYDNKDLVFYHYEWPEEFDWTFIGEQFQRGYDACTGDWAIRMDLDYLLHEDDFKAIREFLETCNAPVACFPKRQFLKSDRYSVKAILPIAYNKKKYGNRIKLDSGGDLCQPSLDGKEIIKEEMPIVARKVPTIVSDNVTDEQKMKRLPGVFVENGMTYTYGSFIPIYNYECIIKTKGVQAKEFYRMARAWGRTFGENMMGIDSEEKALEKFLQMQIGRYKTAGHNIIPLDQHPKYIQETIKNLTPEQFGFDCWGNV